jgi:hypothetical protein
MTRSVKICSSDFDLNLTSFICFFGGEMHYPLMITLGGAQVMQVFFEEREESSCVKMVPPGHLLWGLASLFFAITHFLLIKLKLVPYAQGVHRPEPSNTN